MILNPGETASYAFRITVAEDIRHIDARLRELDRPVIDAVPG
jgi:hypothetical protein